MRVLFLNPTLGTGGAERLTSTYAIGMLGRGHEVGLAYGFSESLGPPLREAGVDLFRVSDRQLLRAADVPEWLGSLRTIIREFKPDVVHAQSVRTAMVARLASRKVPMLVTVHGISSSDESLAALALRAANVKLTAVSEASAEGLQRFSWAPPVGLLSPGVDFDKVRAQSVASESPALIGQPRLCCVARQEVPKGVDVLIRALAGISSEIPDAGLTVVGWGSLLESNRALAAELGLADRVQFTDLVPNATPYIAASDLVILPSRREGLPVVALETLGLERPLVATRVGGTPAVVIDGQTGWLVPPEDEQALGQAILSALADPAEAARRAAAGRALVESRYGAEPMLDRLEDLLIEVSTSGARVPGTKSKPYYRAVRAHQRARIELARIRATPSDWEGVRIFGYHRIAEESDVYAVSPSTFRRHLELITASGVTPIRLDQALDLLEQPVRGRYACLTFDDGYLDNLEQALPILEEFQIPATVYVIGDVLEGTRTFNWYSDPPAALRVDDLPRLLESGLVDIQAHSRTHPRLPLVSTARLEAEVAGVKEQLESYLPYCLTSFSYPAGFYGTREVDAVLAAGYRAGVSTRPGVNRGGVGLGELHRTMIRWRDSAFDFEAKLTGALDRPSWISSRRGPPLTSRA